MTNDDERMDRAKRIREMREGSREGDSDDDAEQADGGEPTDSEEPASETEEEADADGNEDESDEKQTMEDLVESAAADADEEDTPDELELDDELSVDDELDEMDTTESEEVDEATASEDDHSEPTESEPDGEPAMTATDELPEETTAEDEPETASEEETGEVAAPLPDTETLEDALEGTAESNGEAVAPAADEEMPATPGTETAESEPQEEETRVLEFRLDDEYYCLDIQYIEEIVKEETVTRVPNTPEFVEGVVDLRGQITTILNPKVTLGKDSTDADQLIVVFDSEAFEDQGHIGWVVDDVRQVSPITDSEVNDPPVEEDYINGVIDREDDSQFVIWTSPELALEEADG